MIKIILKLKFGKEECGNTISCGTGACASAVIANKLSLINNDVVVNLDGGKLHININDSIMMTGTAEFVFEGRIDL